MEVYYWKGDWGLPTIDVNCLEVIAYIKFAEAPVSLVPCTTPTCGYKVTDFPLLKTRDGQYESRAQRIIKYFDEMKFFADKWMDPSQHQDILALKALVMDKLHPSLMYYIWLDPDNYAKLARRSYAKKCSFPLNYLVPGRLLRTVSHMIEQTKVPRDRGIQDIKEQMHADGAECLNLLSSFLGDKEYFFGDRPCSLDALVFAHLAILSKAPFPNAKLQNHLKGCDNLLRFVDRVLRVIRPFVPEMKEVTNTPPEETPSIANFLIPVGVAVVAMSSYAVHIGLLSIKTT